MTFASDLKHFITGQFEKNGIRYAKGAEIGSLATDYLQLLNRLVVPVPREVHFSKEIHGSLGELSRQDPSGERKEATKAWSAVFRLDSLLRNGHNVNGYLSSKIRFATGKRSRDKLLWDFGMHHFHLGDPIKQSGSVRRSPYLLFSIVTNEHAYFVDVRPHPKGNDMGWARQDLLQIVKSNWPELVEPRVLRGIKPGVVTDSDILQSRNRNMNHTVELDGDAVASLGGGVMTDGSSLECRMWASRLLQEIRRHQSYFDDHPPEFRSRLLEHGVESSGPLKFRLVSVDVLNLSHEFVESITHERCLSRDLFQFGFLVVEETTGVPIVVRLP